MRVKFSPSDGTQSTRAVTRSPAITAGRFVSKPIIAASDTVNVTPAQACLPAEFIKPGKSAPRNGKATIRKSDTRTPVVFCASKCEPVNYLTLIGKTTRIACLFDLPPTHLGSLVHNESLQVQFSYYSV
jgi:hypothetical protein